MSLPLSLLCSPRPNGVSDALAGAFARGMHDAGVFMHSLALRDYAVAACNSCGACTHPPHECILAQPGDQAEELFAQLAQAPFLLVASPIHFYALPANFKALIDRAQRFWAAQTHTSSNIPVSRAAVALLAAGRPRGARLFDGALLTLAYFCRTQGFSIHESHGFRALENRQALNTHPQVLAAVQNMGRSWGIRLIDQGFQG